MFNIGDAIIDLFGSNEWGLLLCVFLIFFIDSFFPTFPELFFVFAFMYDPTTIFGLELLIIAIVAEVLGAVTLYYITGRLKIPKKIENAATKYIDFLVLGNERLLLLNRIAPMIPFSGAFIRILGWNLKKSIMYIILGCVIKYGSILVMSDFFFSYFNAGTAQTYTILFIIILIAISFGFSLIRRKRAMLKN